MHRRLFILIALVLGVAALGLWAWSFGAAKSPQGTGSKSATSPAAAPAYLRVITANVRISDPSDGINAWPNRRAFLVKTLLKYNPDIVGTQEVTPAQGAYLIKELGRWYAYFPRAGVGNMKDEHGGAAGKLLGAVNESFASLNTLFYRADGFDIIDGEAGLALPDDLQRDPSENTFFTLAVLKEKNANPKTLIVVDTHIRHNAAFAVKCALAIREKIGEQLKKYPGAKVIVMGDMNHDRTSKVYVALGGAANAADGAGVLKDSFDYSKKRPNESWGNWHAFTGKAASMNPTDLIFSRGFIVKDTQIVRDADPAGHYPSDHFFVATDLGQE